MWLQATPWRDSLLCGILLSISWYWFTYHFFALLQRWMLLLLLLFFLGYYFKPSIDTFTLQFHPAYAYASSSSTTSASWIPSFKCVREQFFLWQSWGFHAHVYQYSCGCASILYLPALDEYVGNEDHIINIISLTS